MENASKALLIAGGILITIIIASVLVYMYTSASQLPRTQEQIKEAEELSAFNKQYETYYKNNIRGTDLMTVVNMADNNNAKYDGEKDYYITIELYIENPIDEAITKYTYNPTTKKWVKGTPSRGGEISGWYYNEKSTQHPSPRGKGIQTTNIKGAFQVDVNKNSSTNDTGVLYSYDNSVWIADISTIQDKINEQGYYWTKNRTNSELKRRKFNCTSIEYHPITGRVCYMCFEENP